MRKIKAVVKLLLFVLVAIVMYSTGSVLASVQGQSAIIADGEIPVYIDGELMVDKYVVNGDNNVHEKLAFAVIDNDGEIAVRLKVLAKYLGYDVNWDNEYRAVKMSSKKNAIIVTVGEDICLKCSTGEDSYGNHIKLRKPAFILDDFTYLPQSFLLDIFGIECKIENSQEGNSIKNVHLSTSYPHVAVSYENYSYPLGRQIYTSYDEVNHLLSLIPEFQHDWPTDFRSQSVNYSNCILVEVIDSESDNWYIFFPDGLVKYFNIGQQRVEYGVEIVPDAYTEIIPHIDYDYSDMNPDTVALNIRIVDKNGDPIPNLHAGLEYKDGKYGTYSSGWRATDINGCTSLAVLAGSSYQVIIADLEICNAPNIIDINGPADIRNQMDFYLKASEGTNQVKYIWEYPSPREMDEAVKEKNKLIFTDEKGDPVKGLEVTVYFYEIIEYWGPKKEILERTYLGTTYEDGIVYWLNPGIGKYNIYASFSSHSDESAQEKEWGQSYDIEIDTLDYNKEFELDWEWILQY